MVALCSLDDELYRIVHLNETWEDACRNFKCNPKGYELEAYLKYNALVDEIIYAKTDEII